MATPKIGLQLIVYGGRQNEDLAGVLAEVKEAGYAGIEAGNLFDACGESRTPGSSSRACTAGMVR